MQCLLLLAALLAAFYVCCVQCLRPVIRAPRDAETTGRYIAVLQDDTNHERLLEIVELLRNYDDCTVYGYMEVAIKVILLELSDDVLQEVFMHTLREFCVRCKEARGSVIQKRR